VEQNTFVSCARQLCSIALNSNILLRLQNIQMPGVPINPHWQMQPCMMLARPGWKFDHLQAAQ